MDATTNIHKWCYSREVLRTRPVFANISDIRSETKYLWHLKNPKMKRPNYIQQRELLTRLGNPSARLFSITTSGLSALAFTFGAAFGGLVFSSSQAIAFLKTSALTLLVFSSSQAIACSSFGQCKKV